MISQAKMLLRRNRGAEYFLERRFHFGLCDTWHRHLRFQREYQMVTAGVGICECYRGPICVPRIQIRSKDNSSTSRYNCYIFSENLAWCQRETYFLTWHGIKQFYSSLSKQIFLCSNVFVHINQISRMSIKRNYISFKEKLRKRESKWSTLILSM